MFDKQIEYVRKKLSEISARVRAALVIGVLGLIMTAHNLESRFVRSEEIVPERTVAQEMMYLHEMRENSGEEPTLISREIRENTVRFERGVATEDSATYNKSGTATVLESIRVNGKMVTFLLGDEHVSEKNSVMTFSDSDNNVIPTREVAKIASPQIGVIEVDLLGCEQYIEEGGEVGSDLSICAVAYDEQTNFHNITGQIDGAHEYLEGEVVATYGYPQILNDGDNETFSYVPFWSSSTLPPMGEGYYPDYTLSSDTVYASSWSSGEPAGYDGLDLIAPGGMSGGPVVAGVGSEDQKIVAVIVSGNLRPEYAPVSAIDAGIQDIPANFMS